MHLGERFHYIWIMFFSSKDHNCQCMIETRYGYLREMLDCSNVDPFDQCNQKVSGKSIVS